MSIAVAATLMVTGVLTGPAREYPEPFVGDGRGEFAERGGLSRRLGSGLRGDASDV